MIRLAPERNFVVLAPEGAERAVDFPGVPRHTFPSSALPVFGRYLRDPAIRRLAARLKLDVLHDMANGGLPLTSVQAAKIETVHDTVAYAYPELVPNSVRRWYRSTIPKVLDRADLIITVGHVVKADLVKFLGLPGTKIRVVQNGVDERFRPIAGKEECRRRAGFHFPFVLFLGNLIPKRNVHRLVEGFARIAPHHPTLRLVLAGPYDPTSAYVGGMRRIIDETGLGNRVVLAGFVNDELLPWLYNAAEAFVYVPFYEGFCLPPLEAMACGIPVVVSDNPPLQEVVGEAAIRVDGYSVEAIAEGLESALSDETRRTDLAEKGRVRVGQFSWRRTAEGVLRAYDEVAAVRGS